MVAHDANGALMLFIKKQLGVRVRVDSLTNSSFTNPSVVERSKRWTGTTLDLSPKAKRVCLLASDHLYLYFVKHILDLWVGKKKTFISRISKNVLECSRTFSNIQMIGWAKLTTKSLIKLLTHKSDLCLHVFGALTGQLPIPEGHCWLLSYLWVLVSCWKNWCSWTCATEWTSCRLSECCLWVLFDE